VTGGDGSRGRLAAGFGAAVLAALAFGVTTPLVQRAGQGAGAFATAALLYAGAAAVSGLAGGRPAGVPRGARLRALAMAAIGAAAAPALLAWGLARTSGVVGALLLELEAPFTLALAVVFYKESAGRRVLAAAVLVTLGGGLAVAARAGASPAVGATGAAAVALASLAWALDNTLSKPLASLHGASVVLVKAGAGATLAAALALALGEPWPTAARAAALLACGATGYGVSLRLYLAAQRALGAGRTASIFAAGPFAGAIVAWALGEPTGPLVLAGAAAMALGVLLHVTERHRHPHHHPALEHTHEHTHDDGHHDHVHDPMPRGAHTHAHAHAAVSHEHEHLDDLHHEHDHGG